MCRFAASGEQLSMIEDFDRSEVVDGRFVRDMLDHIANIKFVRSQIDLSLPEASVLRVEAVREYTRVLDMLASLTWEYAKHDKHYKTLGLEWFKDKTRVKTYLGLSEPRSHTEMREYTMKAESRLKTSLIAFKVAARYPKLVDELLYYLAYARTLFDYNYQD